MQHSLYSTRENFPLSALHPEEQALCANYHPKRQQHFINGRVCAHRALAELGEDVPVIGMHPDKTPHWPEHIRGSITHTEGFAAAIVAHTSEHPALGIDAEQLTRCHAGLWPRILTKEEHAWVMKHPENEQIALATACFSVKESFYKYYYTSPHHHTPSIDLLDIHLQLPHSITHETFSITGKGMKAYARVTMDEGIVLSIVTARQTINDKR
jgi:4'-phosphopantetheinyl transferase EntD